MFRFSSFKKSASFMNHSNPIEKVERICKETGKVEKLKALVNDGHVEIDNIRFVST